MTDISIGRGARTARRLRSKQHCYELAASTEENEHLQDQIAGMGTELTRLRLDVSQILDDRGGMSFPTTQYNLSKD